MHVLEELASRQKLLCPDTRVPVQARAGRIVSASGRDFGELAGPLNFLKGHRETLDPSQVPSRDIERVRAHLELPATPEVDAQIARAIAATGARFGDAHLSAEARILAERFRIPAFELGADAAKAGSAVGRFVSTLGRVFSRTPRTEYRLEHLSNSVGERLTARQEVFRSVRVRNSGNATLASKEGAIATIETQWSTPAGAVLPDSTVSNALPVDVEPGREITLILRLRAPPEAGPHVLNVSLVAAGEPASVFLATTAEIVPCELPVFEYTYFPTLLEYGADHHIAMEEAAAFLAQRYGGRPASVLEIGGGVHPTGHSLALRGHRVVSSDISHSQSILGTLYFRHKMPALAESLAFISCDGTEPFAEEAFDGVVLFAAFHHFADPVSLLREIKRVTRPDGFVFIACETCAPDPSEPQYREELRRGINEQMWSLAEFTAFFRDAGLRVARARVDCNSLKVALAKG
jgi:SAM-dependent methyltransferase